MNRIKPQFIAPSTSSYSTVDRICLQKFGVDAVWMRVGFSIILAHLADAVKEHIVTGAAPTAIP